MVAIWLSHWCANFQGLYSLSGQTSYRKMSWSLEAAKFGITFFQSLWHLTGTSAATLSIRLSNFKVIGPLSHAMSQLRDFSRFGSKTSVHLVNRGTGFPQQYRCAVALVFNWATKVPSYFIESPDRPNMAFLYVLQLWLLFQCAVYIMACDGNVQCKECQSPLVQNIWASFASLGTDPTYLYVGDRHLRILLNNSFVFAPLVKVWITP